MSDPKTLLENQVLPQQALQNYLDVMLRGATEEAEAIELAEKQAEPVTKVKEPEVEAKPVVDVPVETKTVVDAPVETKPVETAVESQPKTVTTTSRERLKALLKKRLAERSVTVSKTVTQTEAKVETKSESKKEVAAAEQTQPQLTTPTVSPELKAPQPKTQVEAAPPVVDAPPKVDLDVETKAKETESPEAEWEAGRPRWAKERFECLLFDVAGLTLAVPLVTLGTIYQFETDELTPLFGQADWFMGLLPVQGTNIKVVDTALWVMPERYTEDAKNGSKYVVGIAGSDWGLACHSVAEAITLAPDQVRWRTSRGKRPWLAGTVVEHMCALMDVEALSGLLRESEARLSH